MLWVNVHILFRIIGRAVVLVTDFSVEQGRKVLRTSSCISRNRFCRKI